MAPKLPALPMSREELEELDPWKLEHPEKASSSRKVEKLMQDLEILEQNTPEEEPAPGLAQSAHFVVRVPRKEENERVEAKGDLTGPPKVFQVIKAQDVGVDRFETMGPKRWTNPKVFLGVLVTACVAGYVYLLVFHQDKTFEVVSSQRFEEDLSQRLHEVVFDDPVNQVVSEQGERVLKVGSELIHNVGGLLHEGGKLLLLSSGALVEKSVSGLAALVAEAVERVYPLPQKPIEVFSLPNHAQELSRWMAPETEALVEDFFSAFWMFMKKQIVKEVDD